MVRESTRVSFCDHELLILQVELLVHRGRVRLVFKLALLALVLLVAILTRYLFYVIGGVVPVVG